MSLLVVSRLGFTGVKACGVSIPLQVSKLGGEPSGERVERLSSLTPRTISSSGRAPVLHTGGSRFDPYIVH